MTAPMPIPCASIRPRAQRLRTAVAVLVAVLGWATETPQPLPSRSDDLAAIYPALMALSTGDVGAIEALPAHLFLAPAATPDPQEPALARRWTLALPAALDRLAPAARATALAALDRRFLALAAGQDEDARARLALRFLPAPAARSALSAAADRAFDHGRLRTFLALGARLGLEDDRRTAAALRLLGSGAAIEPGLALAAPGMPVATAAVPGSTPAGATVAFATAPGWLLACDPWGGVLWQYRLEHRATVVAGDGGALVQDTAGLRLIDEDGAVSSLPPPPPGARPLAVAGGAAWFATGPTVYRLDLADRGVVALALPAPPLAPPLVRGPGSLWLTAAEVLLVEEGRIHARLAHGLDAGPGWRLAGDGDAPLMLDPGGRAFRLVPLDEQLALAEPRERLRLLLQARRPGDALALWRSSPALATDATARALALRALLADRAAVVADPAAALVLAADAQERATVLAAAGALAGGELGAELAALAARHPDVLINLGDDGWDQPPAEWEWVLTGRAWDARDGALARLRVPPAHRQALAEAVPAPIADRPRRLADGGWAHRGWIYRCDAGLTTTEVTCREPDGALRWRRRWPSPDALAAPARAFALRDDTVVAIEGAARLTVLDAGNGERWAALRPQGELQPQQIVLLGRDRIGELGPLGLDTTLRLTDGQGATAIPLPTSARWLVPWGDGALVALSDGRALAYPAGVAVALPADLVRGGAPLITAAGLERDGRRWAWR